MLQIYAKNAQHIAFCGTTSTLNNFLKNDLIALKTFLGKEQNLLRIKKFNIFEVLQFLWRFSNFDYLKNVKNAQKLVKVSILTKRSQCIYST